MRFHEFLTEGYSDDQLITIATAIMKDCQPYLKMIDNKPLTYELFRGEESSDESLLTNRRCPKNRLPRDSAIENHKVADSWFLKTAGIRFRSNAFFATGDADTAAGYGNVYMIFPKGPVSFCWSPAVKDITDEVFSNIEFDDYDTVKEFKSALVDELTALEYQTTALKEAIISGHEIMIHCREAYMLLVDNHNDRKVLQYIEKTAKGAIPQRTDSARLAIISRIKQKEASIRYLQKIIDKKQEAIAKAESTNQKEFEYYKTSLPDDYAEMEELVKELQELKTKNSVD